MITVAATNEPASEGKGRSAVSSLTGGGRTAIAGWIDPCFTRGGDISGEI